MTRAETKAVEILHAMEAKGGPMSQSQQILAHLFANGAITPLDALRMYGCFRMGRPDLGPAASGRAHPVRAGERRRHTIRQVQP